MAYNLTKKVPFSFEESLTKTKLALANEGFGVIACGGGNSEILESIRFFVIWVLEVKFGHMRLA